MKHEIIQALECCIKRETIPCDNRNCPYFNKTNKYKDCQNLLYENVLKYITGETGINPPNRTSGVQPPEFHIDGREVMRLAGVTPCKESIITELRPCYVGARKALFHKWEKKQTASPLGGMLEFTVALVEFENGDIETRSPQYIRFADSTELFKHFFDEAEAQT